MAEAQYLLIPVGILDRPAARRLVEEVEYLLKKGYEQVEINGERLFPVLSEGLAELSRAAQEELRDHQANIHFFDLHPESATRFLLHGWRVDRRRTALGEATEAELAEEDAGLVVDCEQCGATFRVPTEGDYACPSCGATFHADERGVISYYES